MAEMAVRRILDANANRAREALRVAEDYARFALDSPRLAEALKGLRHTLRERLEAFGLSAEALLAARDTPGDVGTPLTAPREMLRASAAEVAMAALKRLEEALRCLEEYGKALSAPAAGGFKALRYAAYEIELQLFRPARGRLTQAQLYVVLGPVQGRELDLAAAGRAALRGGADIVQLRLKGAAEGEVLALARTLREATREQGALFIVNDRPDIALLADADGVHLGADDLPVRAARRILGAERLVGGTANTAALARQAEAEGADYLGCGAVFPSPTKPGREVIGAARYAEVAAAVRIPVFAIGGIGLDNVAELVAAGCGRVAVSAGLLAADDIEATARSFKERLRPAGIGEVLRTE